MWTAISVAILVGGLLALAKMGAFRLSIPALSVNVEFKLPEAGAPGRTKDLPIMPTDVKEFIAMESEDHAREDLRLAANELYQAIGSWDGVLPNLQKLYGDEA